MGSSDGHEVQALSWGLSLAILGVVRNLSSHFYPEITKTISVPLFFETPGMYWAPGGNRQTPLLVH